MKENEYHEINQYKDASFPVGLYRVNETGISPLGRGIKDFHWHDELQFTLAVSGSLTLQVDAGQYVLNEGEAAFINSGMIHAVICLSEGGQYASLNFPYKLVSFFPGSRMEKTFVLPYITSGHPPVVILRPQTEWQTSVLAILQEINALWDSASESANAYFISTRITAVWYLLFSNLPNDCEKTGIIDLTHRQRLQHMLSFIYEHYSENVALADIAESAHISTGECCRIFRKHLQTTPYQFLTEYRVRKSIELLPSVLSISEIAGRCGYNQTSNYIAKFKSVIGCTPAQYRKQNR